MLAVLSFILVLGLLFASFAVASAFSKTISGFRGAGALTLTPLAAASRIGGLAGRGLFGAPAGWVARQLQEAGWAETALGRAAMRPFAGIARSSFDALGIGAVRKGVAGFGAPTFGKDIGVGGHWGVQERLAKELEKQGRGMAPSAEARGKLAEEAGQKIIGNLV